MALTEEKIFECADLFGEMVYSVYEEDAVNDGEVLFVDAVAEAEEYIEILNELNLDIDTDDKLNMGAVSWAEASAKEAFASGFKAAMRFMEEAKKSRETQVTGR